MDRNRKLLWSASPTPFLSDGSLDREGVRKIAEQYLRLGADGILACGTTGEGPWMPSAQRAELVSLLKGELGDKMHVAVQVSDTSSARVQENMRTLANTGADSFVIAPPLMTRFCAPSFVRRYFLEPIEASPLPVGLYILLPPAAPPVDLRLWRELASHPKVRFVKDSSSFIDVQNAFLTVKAQRPELTLLTGNEFDVVSAAAAGFDGALAGTGIIVGGLLRHALDALAAGDRSAADAWQKRSNECLWGLFDIDRSRWLGGLKHALKYLGICQDEFMHIAYPLTDEGRREIEATCEKFREFIFPADDIEPSSP